MSDVEAAIEILEQQLSKAEKRTADARKDVKNAMDNLDGAQNVLLIHEQYEKEIRTAIARLKAE